MSAADQGRTEDATTKQREKFRGEGNVAKSQELNQMTQYLGGYIVLALFGSYIINRTMEMMRQVFSEADNFEVIEDLLVGNYFYWEWLMITMLPLFITLIVMTVGVLYWQVGWKVTWKPIMPKMSKLNIFSNFKRIMLSQQTLMELAKSLAKVGVLTWLIIIAVEPLREEYPSLLLLTPAQIGEKLWEYVSLIWLYIIAFMLVIAIADYRFQKYRLDEQMKMTKQQVEDEMKQAQGDPKVKAALRRKSMEMMQRILSQQTSQADVVITNPTHFAVALAYKHGSMGAPKVVAKGADHVALRIRRLARKEDIPIVENRTLARALYYGTEIGEEIPEDLFRPVAEILAFIFNLKKKAGA